MTAAEHHPGLGALSDAQVISSHPTSWADVYAALAHAWAEIASDDDVAAWRRQLTEMEANQLRLRLAGRWRRDPADLLFVCSVHRRELIHSAVLAWLCEPGADHGLADRFLRGLLELGGAVTDLELTVDVRTEVSRETSRADLVVQTDAWTLVLELKIDAGEQAAQCQRLYDDWAAEPGVRLMFITPTGRAPSTAYTPAAHRAWQPVAWRQVLEALERAVTDAGTSATSAVTQYLQTLHRLYGRRIR